MGAGVNPLETSSDLDSPPSYAPSFGRTSAATTQRTASAAAVMRAAQLGDSDDWDDAAEAALAPAPRPAAANDDDEFDF